VTAGAAIVGLAPWVKMKGGFSEEGEEVGELVMHFIGFLLGKGSQDSWVEIRESFELSGAGVIVRRF
jgi:hypothetical protein